MAGHDGAWRRRHKKALEQLVFIADRTDPDRVIPSTTPDFSGLPAALVDFPPARQKAGPKPPGPHRAPNQKQAS
jgi:hypothetical protein